MNDKVNPRLAELLETTHSSDKLEVQIFLRQDEPAFAEAVPDLAEARRVPRESSVASISHFLGSVGGAGAVPVQAHFQVLQTNWINQSVAAEVSPTSLQEILQRPDVEHVDLVDHTPLTALIGTELIEFPPPPNTAKIAPQVSVVGATHLWDRGLRGAGALVAVIDSGINFDQPDLKECAWDGDPNHGFNYASPGDPPHDKLGHGTKCAGLVAGNGSLGLTTGVAPEAKLMALRIEEGQDQVWSAFRFAIENNADVISMSFGWGPDISNYVGWRRACDSLLRAGIVLVCSAGDLGQTGNSAIPYNVTAPAICPPPWLHPVQKRGGRSAAIACGETDFADDPQPESSLGPGAWETRPFTDYRYAGGKRQGLLKPDLCAPGRGAITCNWKYDGILDEEPYLPFGGTSASTPVLAGCAALLVGAAKRSGKPVLAWRIQEAMERTAVPLKGQTTKQNIVGSGRVDVAAAYGYGVAKGWWK
jgi:subtilisin family serine protease